jgi:hypothetical protein
LRKKKENFKETFQLKLYSQLIDCLGFLLERVGNVLHRRQWILLHVLDICNGSIESTFGDRVSGIHHHPTFEIYAVAVSASSAGADEGNSMVSYVKHVDKSVAIKYVGA